jgi:hypothetical protein
VRPVLARAAILSQCQRGREKQADNDSHASTLP